LIRRSKLERRKWDEFVERLQSNISMGFFLEETQHFEQVRSFELGLNHSLPSQCEHFILGVLQAPVLLEVKAFPISKNLKNNRVREANCLFFLTDTLRISFTATCFLSKSHLMYQVLCLLFL
jgi:hypothetical protein